MWAFRMIAPRRMERIDVPDLDAASLAPGHLLLRPMHGGLCGSDYPAYRGLKSQLINEDGALAAESNGFPLHEVVGEVVADPTGTHQPGTVVVGWATGFDALAELVATKASSVVAVPDDIEVADAITLQPLACVLYTLDRLTDCLPGAKVAVIGLGPIGLLFAHGAKQRGAASVTGVDPADRSAIAAEFGIDDVITTTSDRWASRLTTDPVRYDVVIEAVGHQVGTLTDAVNAVRMGGTIFYFGIPDDRIYPFPMAVFLRRSARLVSGAVLDHGASLDVAIEYARSHPTLLAQNISHRFDIADANEAFEVGISTFGDRRKVVLDY
ncbi:MAG: zinc-binding dehydrogenase [Cumulibacter sp.]